MSNAVIEREIFWNMYQETLLDKGNPFYISPKKQWAVVNKPTANWNSPIIAMDFLVRKRILRINAFLLNDIDLFEKLCMNKSKIENDLGFTPIWTHGEKGDNTYRIKTELSFLPCNRSDYSRVINNSIPIVQKYVKAFSKYILS